MRFLGGLLKFFSILLMLAVTILCTVVIVMEGVVEGYEEAIWIMSAVWVGAMLICLSILGTGVALTQVAKLKKRVKQLEQQPIAPVYHAPVKETRVETPVVQPVVETPAVAEVQEATVVTPVQPVAPPVAEAVPSKKKPAKWIPVVAIAAVAIIAIVVIVAVGGNKTEQNPQMQKPDSGKPNQSATIAPPAEEPEKPTDSDLLENAVHVTLGDVIENEFFSMTIDSIDILDEFSYRTSEYSTTSLFVEEGYKLLMIKGHFENRSTVAISDSMLALTATVNNTYKLDGFDVKIDFLRSKSFEIDPYTDLDYVLHINIPNKLADMYENVTFTLGYNNDLSIPTTIWNMDGTKTTEVDNLYAISSDGGFNDQYSEAEKEAQEAAGENPPQETAQTIGIGQTVETKDYIFTLRNVELTYEVLPPNTSSVYTSYTAESGKVFVHVEADVKNVMQRDLRIDELFKSSVLYDGKYPYAGFQIVNDGDNRFDWVGSYVAATPLETCKAHSIIECPAEVDESGKSVVVKLTIGDQVYEYVLR